MKFSHHLIILAIASITPVQVFAGLVLANAPIFCLRPLLDPPVNGTRVQVAYCPRTSYGWILDSRGFVPGTNSSLCLDHTDLGLLQVNTCNLGVTQRFRFNGTTGQVQAPDPNGPVCVDVGSSVAPCNASDLGQVWAPSSV